MKYEYFNSKGQKMKKVLLYSGGLDSYIINQLWKPDVLLYFDYGTKQNKAEISRLPNKTIIKNINLSEYIQEDGIKTIPLRNLIFATLAINYGEVIAIGGVKEDWHYDKSEEFCTMTTNLFNSVLTKDIIAKEVKVVVPFKKYSKTELIEMYLKNGNNIKDLYDKSWTCHNPIIKNDKYIECKKCKTCERKYKILKKFK